MAYLSIKGHPTRGKEVIQLLEMLGGTNDYFKHDGKIENFYYYIGNNNHIYQCGLPSEMKCFTLEEFEEKYPFKVGDNVTLDNKLCSIIWMCWECNNVYYQVQGIGAVFTKKVTAEDLQPFKEEAMEDKDIIEQTTEINLNHPCFDGRNKIELIIPENWKFEQRGDKMFGIRKYPQYPKTYKECCDVLGLNTMDNDAQGYKADLIIRFQELIIARDAYWKIAGEQMGLDKPWEPDWNWREYKFCIGIIYDKIEKFNVGAQNHMLSFPTKEMRDIFYECFKELIEKCKELL